MKIQKLKVRHLESHAVESRQVVSSLALCWLREPSGATGDWRWTRAKLSADWQAVPSEEGNIILWMLSLLDLQILKATILLYSALPSVK